MYENFKEECEDFNNIKDRFVDVKVRRNDKRDKLKALIDEAKENVRMNLF